MSAPVHTQLDLYRVTIVIGDEQAGEALIRKRYLSLQARGAISRHSGDDRGVELSAG
jgi:hypothetical protein